MNFGVTTYEMQDGQFKPVISHIFHANSETTAKKIVEAHRKVDKFFDGSFKGEWEGMKLSNSKMTKLND